ncbi:MAG: cyclic nucleotide-binding domain-containing protein [Pseudomonadota bacterium]
MSNEDFDFTRPPGSPAPAASGASAPFKPASSKFYDAYVAEKFFQTAGKPEKIAAGTTLFVEGDKSGKQGLFGKRVVHQMYFVTEGEVMLTVGDRQLDTIKAGEVVGEMAVIAEIPGVNTASARSATATAKTDCLVYALDGIKTQAGLAETPEFALMLMSVMFDRMRFLAARLAMRRVSKKIEVSEAVAAFAPDMLATLKQKLDRSTVMHYDAEKPIMKEGATGMNMYVILRGQVAISIKGTIVEVAGPGSTIGEMALVDQSPRAATATAKTDCVLLAINRAALIDLVQDEPAIGMALMRSMADRLRYMNSLFS